jgi:hypothetical protein
VQY